MSDIIPPFDHERKKTISELILARNMYLSIPDIDNVANIKMVLKKK